jgi:DNA-binding IclR family transcriptional regulator
MEDTSRAHATATGRSTKSTARSASTTKAGRSSRTGRTGRTGETAQSGGTTEAGSRAASGKATGTGSVTSRALRVLEAFSPGAPELSLTDISRHTGLPLTTAHRLVSELAEWGALEREPGGGYRIGLRLWEVAALAPRGLGLRELALPHLSDLARATGENVQLAVREGHSVVYVERLAGRGSVPVLTRVGGRFALTPTGVGRVLLAYAPTSFQEYALAQAPARFTERTVCDPVVLRQALAEVRRAGVAVCERQVTMDSLSVAAPVHGLGGEVTAAVSVVAHIDSVAAHTLVPLVRAAAAGISRALGSQPTSAAAAPPSPAGAAPPPPPAFSASPASSSRQDPGRWRC